MELLVISDSHGKYHRIAEAFARNKGCYGVVFLGDGCRDMDRVDFGCTPVIKVKGNCDMFMSEDLPEERVFYAGKIKIFACHGHTLGVKHGLSCAIERAVSLDADMLLYGHTHVPHSEYIGAGEKVGNTVLKKPLWVFNPGSIGESGTSKGSFGIITVQGSDILTSFGEI